MNKQGVARFQRHVFLLFELLFVRCAQGDCHIVGGPRKRIFQAFFSPIKTTVFSENLSSSLL